MCNYKPSTLLPFVLQALTILSFLFFLFLLSHQNDYPHCTVDLEFIQKYDSLKKTERYVEWEKNQWQQYGEPFYNSMKKETYRISIEPSFNYNVFIYKFIEISRNKYKVIIKEFEKCDYPDPLNLVRYCEEQLSKEDWVTVKKMLYENCFWGMNRDKDNSRYLDPTIYRIEAYTPRKNKHTNRQYCTASRQGGRDKAFYSFKSTSINDTYTPLITDKDTEWYTIDWLPYEHFYLVGDTIIDNLKYRKLYVSYIGGVSEHQNLYAGALIEIEKKVYVRGNSVNILLYDFTLVEGEQIRIRGIKEEDGVLLTVTAVDSVQLLNGEWRTRWYLDNEYGTAFNDIWIEGIGSLNGVLMPGMATVDVDIVLISQLQDGELVYCNPEFADVVYPGSFNKKCNALVSNTTTINNKTNFLTATPSIFKHQTQLHFSLPKSSNISLHIFNHQGQIITSLYDKEQLQMGEYQQSLSLPNVSSGIYYAVLLINGRRVATQKLVLMK